MGETEHNFVEVFSSIQKEFDDWRGGCVETAKEISIQCLADLQTISPVDKGLYRSAHDLTISEPSSHDPKEVSSGQGMQEAQKQIDDAVQKLEALANDLKQARTITIFITNNLPYAEALEYGHSKQAPNGIYGIVALRAAQYIKQAEKL